jgi:hypothetical protein
MDDLHVLAIHHVHVFPALGFTFPACSISEVHFACSVDTRPSILSASNATGFSEFR